MSAPLKPGWKMTEDQHALFWRLWSAACRGQGWFYLKTAERNARRKEVLRELGFTSAKLIDSRDGFDHVRERLEALADRVHNERPDAGHRRRLLWNIDQARSRLNAAGYPAAALDKILRQRFKVIPGLRTVADLETEELVNLLRTLTARARSWKQRQEFLAVWRALLLNLALHNLWPPRSARPDPRNAPGTAPASAAHPLCSPHSDLLQRPGADLFFAG